MVWFVESGQTRLVRRTMASSRSGSHQREVPVKPRCPKEEAEKNLPDDEGGVGRSHPSARVVPGCWRVKSEMMVGSSTGLFCVGNGRLPSQQWAKTATS